MFQHFRNIYITVKENANDLQIYTNYTYCYRIVHIHALHTVFFLHHFLVKCKCIGLK